VQLGDLALVLRLLALQLGSEIGGALFSGGGALALGGKFELQGLDLPGPLGFGFASSGLFFVQCLLCREQGSAARLGLGGAGLLLLRKLGGRLARGHAFAVDLREKPPLVREVALLGFFGRTLPGGELHLGLLAQRLLAGKGLVERLAQASQLGLGIGEEPRGFLLLDLHLRLHRRERLPGGSQCLVELDSGLLEGRLALLQVGFFLRHGFALQFELAPDGGFPAAMFESDTQNEPYLI
jgi:hypothetical protein